MEHEKVGAMAPGAHDSQFEGSYNRLMDNLFGAKHPQFCPADRIWHPPTDIFETSEVIHIKMELAGVRDEDIDVKTSNNFLVVRGRRHDEQHIRRENFHLMEIHYGSFERVFGFPNHMELRDVTATLRNGFLLITIPKDSRLREYRIEIE